MNKINEQLFYNHWVNNLEEIKKPKGGMKP